MNRSAAVSRRRGVFVAVTVGLAAGFALGNVAASEPDAPPSSDASSGPRPQTPAEVAAELGLGRTRDGAIAAAAAYVTSGEELLRMDPLAAEETVRESAIEETADQQVADTLAGLTRTREQLATGTGPIVYRQAAVAWRLDTFTQDRARIAVWHVGVLARAGVAAPQSGWAISWVDLVWDDDRWKVHSEQVVPGPAPALDGSAPPATAEQLAAALDGFQRFEPRP